MTVVEAPITIIAPPVATHDHREPLTGAVPSSATEFGTRIGSLRVWAIEVCAAVALYAAIDHTATAADFIYDEERNKTPRDRRALRSVQDLYLDGEDIYITYDEATTTALEQDQEYQRTLAESNASLSERGPFSVDQARLYRLTFFMERVTDYRNAGGREQVFYTE